MLAFVNHSEWLGEMATDKVVIGVEVRGFAILSLLRNPPVAF